MTEQAPVHASLFVHCRMSSKDFARSVEIFWQPSAQPCRRPLRQHLIRSQCNSGRRCRLVTSFHTSLKFLLPQYIGCILLFSSPLWSLFRTISHAPASWLYLLESFCSVRNDASFIFIFLQCLFPVFKRRPKGCYGQCWTVVEKDY